MTEKRFGGVALGGRWIAGGGLAVEEVDLVRAILHAAAEDVDKLPFADFALETGEKPAARRAVILEVENSRASAAWLA